MLADELKVFFSTRLKLKLTNAQLSRLIFILDNDCIGFVRRDEFQKILSMYNVQSEKQVESELTGEQQVLMKIGARMIQMKLNEKDVFKACAKYSDNYILSQDLFKFLSSGGIGLYLNSNE